MVPIALREDDAHVDGEHSQDAIMTKSAKVPCLDHPITIRPARGRVVVRSGAQVLADTQGALELREAGYPPVFYIPRSDAPLEAFVRSEHKTYCPYKGDCSYFSIPALGTLGENAVWTYEAPYEAVAAIRDYLAFYPNRVSIEME